MNLRKKSDSRLMKLLDLVLRHTTGGRFMFSFWTTVGDTVYVPTKYDGDFDWGTLPWERKHADVLAHEQVHIDQRNGIGMLAFAVFYLGPSPFMLVLAPLLALGWPMLGLFEALAAAALAPLSVGLAYGRWRLEREAYLTQVRAALRDAPAGSDRYDTVYAIASQIADTLWHNYLFTWPRSWAIDWFLEHA